MKTQITQDVFNTITSADWKRSIEFGRNRRNEITLQIEAIEDEMISKLETANFGYFAEELCIPVNMSRAAYFALAIPLAQFAEICKIWPQKVGQWKIDLRNCKKEILEELLENSRLFRPHNSNPSSFPVSGDPFSRRQNGQLMFPLPVT